MFPSIGEQGEVQEPRQRFQDHLSRGWSQEPFPWLGPNSHRLLHAGRLQVRILRGLQEHLFRNAWRGKHVHLQNVPLFGKHLVFRVQITPLMQMIGFRVVAITMHFGACQLPIKTR